MAYPATKRQRALYETAKRVRDELGKGQELLRHTAPIRMTPINGEVRSLAGIFPVPVRLVDVRLMGEGANLTSIDLLAPAAYDSAAAAGNQLMTQVVVAPADNFVEYGVLLTLANRVEAEQPIIISVIAGGGFAGTVEVVVDYILCDAERTY